MTTAKTRVPSAFERLDEWRAQRRAAGHLLLALDFDGTLAPIVPHPDHAQLAEGARTAIERLLKRPDTDVAFVSGRSLDDLRDRCGLDGAYYAGNHGLQIDGPGVHETRQEALARRPAIRDFARRLQARLANEPAVYFEDKDLSLSVHYRTFTDDAEEARLRGIVESEFARAGEGIRLTYGKKVVEVRPDVTWHKGSATLFLIESVERARNSQVFPLFIGDDRTDEDAFEAIRSKGAGIVVGTPEYESAATACLSSIDDVIGLITLLGADEGY